MAWAYTNEDSSALLEDLATREVVRYLVEADMNEILSIGRQAAAVEMQARIQSAADGRTLGAKILSVGLNDLHPPVKVAPDYEKVVSAIHTKQAKILAARADAIRTNGYASSQSRSVVNKAAADAVGRETTALAQAALFTNQIPAYKAAPAVYLERAYLQGFVRATANARKYLLLTTNTHNVIQFDLQDKLSKEILSDNSAPSVKPK
jgi:regulator of protease activity HflC (stomatin/prohibitin superfamily)